MPHAIHSSILHSSDANKKVKVTRYAKMDNDTHRFSRVMLLQPSNGRTHSPSHHSSLYVLICVTLPMAARASARSTCLRPNSSRLTAVVHESAIAISSWKLDHPPTLGATRRKSHAMSRARWTIGLCGAVHIRSWQRKGINIVATESVDGCEAARGIKHMSTCNRASQQSVVCHNRAYTQFIRNNLQIQ